MRCSTTDCVVFSGEQLLPPQWQPLAAGGPVRTFNPGLLRTEEGWIFAYRIVASDGLRRIGLCRLDHSLQIVAGSKVPWSDHVRFRTGAGYPEIVTRWFADPRLYRFGERLLIYWNSGWHEPRNFQFVQELDRATLLPLGNPRELLLHGNRQKLEKNWTFFAEGSGAGHAIYSIQPHRVLRFSLDGSGDIEFEPLVTLDWSLPAYPENHGGLRGGAPPVLAHGQYWSFCHSVHDGPNGYRYSPAVYSFSAEPPFAPVWRPTRVLELGNPFGANRKYERLNSAVGEVIYPCGAAVDGARWLISHGINDEHSAISTVEHSDVLATLRPVAEISKAVDCRTPHS